jgi:putative phosphoribosyl transferase
MNPHSITIPAGDAHLEGELALPPEAKGLVIFAHGSGSSRHSPRNQQVATSLRAASFGTLLFDLLTPEEEADATRGHHLRFHVTLLASRLVGATQSVRAQTGCREVNLGYFGASTGAAAALVAAAELGDLIRAVVSRGGRPDLATDALGRVRAATLLIVGAKDTPVIPLNEEAYFRLHCEKAMRSVPGASHLFEEPGALEEAARMAIDWFGVHFGGNAGRTEATAIRSAPPPPA